MSEIQHGKGLEQKSKCEKKEKNGFTVETKTKKIQGRNTHVRLHFELVIFAGYGGNRRRENENESERETHRKLERERDFFYFFFVAFFFFWVFGKNSNNNKNVIVINRTM